MIWWLFRGGSSYFLVIHTETFMKKMISGICFKIFQEQGVGTVSGEYRSKKIGHVVIIIEAG